MFNKVYHQNFLNNNLEDKCASLIIADPPYFKTKGHFDFIWKSFEDYLKDVEKWSIECKRLLADNGTLFWWGSAKNIAYTQIILDKNFKLINNLVWDKGSFMGLEKSKELRSFAPCTERLLMYGNNIQDKTGLDFIEKEYVAPRNPFSIELKKARKLKGLSINKIAEYGKFYGKVNHGGSVTNWEKGYNIPTEKQWNILCKILPINRQEYEEIRQEYEEIRQEYEEIRQKYEEVRRPFNNIFNIQEVLRFNNESIKNRKYNHDTVKPENITSALILTCSNKNDLVVIPFAGSGTECAMAIKNHRKAIGFEIEKKYVDISNKRISNIIEELNQLKIE